MAYSDPLLSIYWWVSLRARLEDWESEFLLVWGKMVQGVVTSDAYVHQFCLEATTTIRGAALAVS